MIDILEDIRHRLQAGEYKNEEHIRLSLVARVVQAAGWNIWNPTEVYTEFKATETEDNTRVDVALFANNFERDTIFIECKGAGRIGDDLTKVERQLRDYNRNHSALFTLITDGQHWRFYFSLTSGEFAQKLFGKLDLLADDVAETAAYFQTFLSRTAILSGTARHEAESYLLLSRKERIMKDALPDAEKHITQPPFPALPEALMELLAARGLTIKREEAVAFLAGETLPKPNQSASVAAPALLSGNDLPAGKSSAKKSRIKAVVPTVVSSVESKVEARLTFVLTLSRLGVKADAYRAADKSMTVLAGSTAMPEARTSLSPAYKTLRDVLQQQQVLVPAAELLLFTQDYTFKTAGQAADIICGYSVNAKQAWRDNFDKPLGEYF